MKRHFKTVLLTGCFVLALTACATEVRTDFDNGGVGVGVDNGQTGVLVDVDATHVAVGVDSTLASVTVVVPRQAIDATNTAIAAKTSGDAAATAAQAVANGTAAAQAASTLTASQAGFIDIPIPTSSVATQTIREILPAFPIGEQTLSGVFFRIDEKGKVTTQCQATSDESIDHGTAPTDITIPVPNLSNIHSIFVLLNAGFTAGVANLPVGSLTLHYADGSTAQQSLVLNFNIREWGISTPGTIATISDPNNREIYRGNNRFGAVSVIDMLEVPVPAANQGKTLVGLTLSDNSQTTAKNPNPCLFVVAATARQAK